MKILSIVDISPQLVKEFEKEFPGMDYLYSSKEENYADLLPDVDIIFGNVPFKKLGNAKKMKWIQIVSSGIDEYREIQHTDIILTTAKGVHWMPIAEYLVFSILYFVKNYGIFNRKKEEKNWYRRPDLVKVLKNQKICIIGFGGIGSALAKCLEAFGPDIEAISLHPEEKCFEGVRISGLEDLEVVQKKADHIILSLPLTDKSRNILSKERLLKVKKGSFIYNVSRGALIDEDALIELLEEGHIAGAALDVFENEPLPYDSRLWNMDNVILTPHISGHYDGLRDDIFRFFTENLRCFLINRKMNNLANFQKGY